MSSLALQREGKRAAHIYQNNCREIKKRLSIKIQSVLCVKERERERKREKSLETPHQSRGYLDHTGFDKGSLKCILSYCI